MAKRILTLLGLGLLLAAAGYYSYRQVTKTQPPRIERRVLKNPMLPNAPPPVPPSKR